MDYYSILGVAQNASKEDIQKAYKKLAAKYHPDVNSDVEASKKFKEIAQAYEYLSSDKPAMNDHFSFDTIFNSFFKERQFPNIVSCSITLAECYKGCEKTISIPSYINCSKCNGLGFSEFVTCNICNGSKYIVKSKGHLRVSTVCAKCDGRGSLPVKPCSCEAGRIPGVDREHRIRIMAGVEHGAHVQITGNDFCQVIVQPHAFYTRKGADLFCKIPVTYSQAFHGGDVRVKTLKNDYCLIKVPARYKFNTPLKLHNMGMPRMGINGYGDLYVHVSLDYPNDTNEYSSNIDVLADIEKGCEFPVIQEFIQNNK